MLGWNILCLYKTENWNKRVSHAESLGNSNCVDVFFERCRKSFQKLLEKILTENKCFGTIDFILIVIFTSFQQIRPSAYFKCFLSKSGAYTEVQFEHFI